MVSGKWPRVQPEGQRLRKDASRARPQTQARTLAVTRTRTRTLTLTLTLTCGQTRAERDKRIHQGMDQCSAAGEVSDEYQ